MLMAMRKQYTLAELKKLPRLRLDNICSFREIVYDEDATDEGLISLILEDQFNLKTGNADKAAIKAAKKSENDPPKPEPEPETKDEGPGTDEPMPTLKAPNGNDRIWFKVMAGSQPHEKDDVFAALNGETMLVKRNHWVKMKTKFLPVFEDAVQTEVYIEDDEPKLRHVPRFNYMTRTLTEGIPQHERRQR